MLVYFQVDIDLRPIVELAHRTGIALSIIELGVHFIIDSRETREAVSTVLTNDVGFHRVGARIGEVDDGADNGVILLVEHLPRKQSALLFIFFVKSIASSRKQEDESASQERRASGRHSGNHAYVIFLCCRMMLTGQVQPDVYAFIILYVNWNLFREMEGFPVHGFYTFKIGTDDVVIFPSGDALSELASMVGINLPSGFLVGGAPDPDLHAKHRMVVGSPHRAKNKRIGIGWF